jgi:hypothetical protein
MGIFDKLFNKEQPVKEETKIPVVEPAPKAPRAKKAKQVKKRLSKLPRKKANLTLI